MDQLKQCYFDQSPAGIAITDLDGLIELANERFHQLTHLHEQHNITPMMNLALPLSVSQIIDDLVQGKQVMHIFEIKHGFTPDTLNWCIIKVSLVDKNEKKHVSFVIEDISRNRQLNPRMNVHLNTIVDSLPVLIAQIDAHNRYLYANKTYEAYFHTTLDQVIGETIENLIGDESFSHSAPFIERVRQGETVTFDNTLFFTNELRVLHLKLVPDEMNRGGFYIFAQDVTELRAFQRSLEFKAYHDALTGLPNRSFFMKSLANVLRYKQHGSALLFLDLDGLKLANDRYGHHIGDGLLKIFAHVLQDAIRPQDFVSRLAGDEFTIILTELDDPLANMREVCQRILDRLPASVEIEGHAIPCSCSIGATLLDHALHLSEETWLARADAAMYKAKTGGKGGFVIE
ncbi:diguanylate cyclase domain-containing protein [Vibrio furnissii]|uniref:diguanylate cyclase domain-containing protein n=1 Tax=Vibrio furnissii TaxID=29494 RepID=UPI0023DBD334|nr:diguanylate cyclase [Vibrio furnissii]